MDRLPIPVQTPTAVEWLTRRDARLHPIERVLLATIDGRRNVIELESVARALGLSGAALDGLQLRGLIEFPRGTPSQR